MEFLKAIYFASSVCDDSMKKIIKYIYSKKADMHAIFTFCNERKTSWKSKSHDS